jgi:hypothetical protein
VSLEKGVEVKIFSQFYGFEKRAPGLLQILHRRKVMDRLVTTNLPGKSIAVMYWG